VSLFISETYTGSYAVICHFLVPRDWWVTLRPSPLPLGSLIGFDLNPMLVSLDSFIMDNIDYLVVA
jgi:O-antigen/teichoic acid export membrane protein